jgi:hypothetical protein
MHDNPHPERTVPTPGPPARRKGRITMPQDDTAPEAPVPPAPAVPAPAVPAPAVPTQSSEDTDIGWGDYAEQDDDRLLGDRPPHWED